MKANLSPFSKIDVTINAPKAGTIVEILAKEEETVSVGQDLYKLAPGGCTLLKKRLACRT